MVGNYVLHFYILFKFIGICVGHNKQSFPKSTVKIEKHGPTLSFVFKRVNLWLTVDNSL